MDTVRTRWNGKRRFVAWDSAGHGVVMDATSEYGGDSSGVRPIEIVLYGLAGCTGMDVISILEKKRQRVTDLEIVVEAEQREEPPRRYQRIHVEYIVTGHAVDPAAVARSIELSEEKYCSVRGMFDSDIEVSSTFTVLEADSE